MPSAPRSGVPRIVAVLDIGKTNVKVAAHDLATGTDLMVRKAPNTVLRDGPYPHYDVAAHWDFFLTGLADLARAHTIDAVTITTHGAAAALVDAAGDLALPVLDYEHDGPAETARAYDALRPAFAETFSPRLPLGLNLGAQLFWLQARFPADFARAAAILTYPQYWAFRLSGVQASETTSLGCHTDLWAPAAVRFSSLVTARGWDRLLPPPRPAFDALGTITPEVAAATGLDPATPVICGLHDSNASLLPHLANPAPFAVVSTGTWVIVFAVGGRADHLDERRDTLANVDAFGRAVPSGRFMGGREYELLVGPDAPKPTEAEVLKVVGTGIIPGPGWAGATGPFPKASPRWLVDPTTLSPGERAAAASVYLALMTETVLGLTSAAGPIIVEGPFGGNAVFTAALAGLTGRLVRVASGQTGTTAGAALTAAGPDVKVADRSVTIAVPDWAKTLGACRARFGELAGAP
jgi:sugar (pentulose or hexulose) kinase